jgi:hypothetical protein
VFPAITGARILQILNDGDYVGVRFELDTVHGTVPAFDWFHVVDGVIVAARPYYDPRPLTTAVTATVV